MGGKDEITGAELVARSLRALGITTVFGLTGTILKYIVGAETDHVFALQAIP